MPRSRLFLGWLYYGYYAMEVVLAFLLIRGCAVSRFRIGFGIAGKKVPTIVVVIAEVSVLLASKLVPDCGRWKMKAGLAGE